jgi:hypothetical protein
MWQFSVISASLVDLEPAPIEQLPTLREYLWQLERYLAISLDFGIWTPTEDDLTGLRFCRRHGNLAEISRFLMDRISEGSHSLLSFDQARPALPATMAEAGAAWLLLEKGAFPDAMTDAWNRFLRLGETERIQPLHEHARNDRDPFRANLTQALAGLTRVVHPRLLTLARRANDPRALDSSNANAQRFEKEMQLTMTMLEQILKLTRGVTTWRPAREQ